MHHDTERLPLPFPYDDLSAENPTAVQDTVLPIIAGATALLRALSMEQVRDHLSFTEIGAALVLLAGQLDLARLLLGHTPTSRETFVRHGAPGA